MFRKYNFNLIFFLIGWISLIGCSVTPPFQSTVRPIQFPGNNFPKSDLLISWPVGRKTKISRGFKRRGRPHLGIDVAGRRGSSIYAAHDGIVIYAGNKFNGYGKLVIIENEEKWASFYAHLHRYFVEEGQIVKRGQVIGQMGNTGNARGVHLHFELRKDLKAVDPIIYLP